MAVNNVNDLVFKTHLTGIIGPSFLFATNIFTSKSPSLMTHGSYLYGLPDYLLSSTIGGKFLGLFFYSPGHGYSLQGLSLRSLPTHGFPPFLGG